jgi:hypothetical protein
VQLKLKEASVPSSIVLYYAAQPSCLTTRFVDAGYFSNITGGRIGWQANPLPQFGQRLAKVVSAQSLQTVHSKPQIRASEA